ncbi:MAG: glycoside hydrolase domain-containing protein, partial [Phyllobacterium sp.]
MTFRRLFIAGLLGCTVLAACDGSDEKAAKPDEAAQSTFDGMQADIGRLAETNQDLLAQIAALKKGTEAGSKETRALIVTLEARVAQQAAALKAKTEADRTLAIAGRTAGDEQGRALAKLAAELAALKTAALPQVTGDIAALKASMQTLTDGLAGLKALEARLAGLETGLAEVKGRTLTADELKAFHDLDARFVALKQDFDKALAGKADKTAIPDIAGLVADVAALKTGKADKQAVTDLQDRLAVLKADMDAAAKLSAVAAGDLAGRLDALEKDMAAVKPLPDQELTKYVNTMRGAWSTGSFTRGNTYPATAVPFGFNFWVPVNRDDGNWFYQFYDDKNDTRLLDKVLAFAVVHMPSPWIGNRQTLQIMPISDQSKTDRSNRGEKFQRSNETAQAHYYSLTFDNGTRTEIAPTDHAAYFRFTAPAGKPKQTILFDTMAGNGSLTIDEANAAVSGYTDHGSPRMYFYARFDSKPSLTRKISPAGVKSWLEFDTPDTAKVVGMRIATSFISVDQARDNLAQEIAADASFDDVKAQAQAAWNEKLNMIQVEGATEDQKTILYSNLYRSFLWPNSAFETVAGEAAYMSPYTSPPALKKGRIWVNNGFWDTYRTTWPLYTLLLPDQAGRMIDGFVNGYKDGGWVTRWSGPGYVDSMVATSSDVIFADAYRKGVRNFDADAAYASM